MSDVTIEQNEQRHRFEARVDGRLAGYITYVATEDSVDLQHTVVRDEYEGQGIGSTLVRTTLEKIRDAGKALIPTCPFVQAYLRRHPEWESLRAS